MTPIYLIESNGPANIVTHVRAQGNAGQPIDSAYVKNQARLFIGYVEKLEAGRQIMWHEHLAEETKP